MAEYLSYHNITCSLGFETTTVFEKLKNGTSGLQLVDCPERFYKPFYGAIIKMEELNAHLPTLKNQNSFTRLELMMIASLAKTIETSGITLNKRVGLIISSTKGNIDVLDSKSSFPQSRYYLSDMGRILTTYFKFENDAIIISNACVSGILTVSIAKRYLQEKIYDHIFIVAGDIITDFVLSGFNSFQALSQTFCKPYDINRAGINLGEAAASVLVTASPMHLSSDAVEILGEGNCNDANHISGPSRNGEGLFRSISAALKDAKIEHTSIDYISAHGTATLYNDEMEAHAFNRAHLSMVPLNSLKGYFGHTLGASGLVETLIGMQSLHQNVLIASAGFEEMGVQPPLHIITNTNQKPLHIFLKTASGFGGCNSAVIFKKVNT